MRTRRGVRCVRFGADLEAPLRPNFRLLFALACLLAPTNALGQEATPLTVRELFSNPSFKSPEISPDGRTLAVIHFRGDVGLILSRPVAGGQATPLAAIDDPEIRPTWLGWANDERILIGAETRMREAIGVRARRTRLFAVNRDGSDFRWLGKRWPRFGDEQMSVVFEDDIAHWTPEEPETVLIRFSPLYRDEWPRVMRMNVASGGLRPYGPSKANVTEWHLDEKAQVRVGIGIDAGLDYVVWARVTRDQKFEEVVRHPVISTQEVFLGFHADPAKIYVVRDLDDRSAIYEFDLRDKKLGKLVFSHPEVDVLNIHLDRVDGRVLGFSYVSDSPQIQYVDAAAAAEHRGLLKALAADLGQSVELYTRSRSRDDKRVILYATSDTQPPVYYVFDRNTKELFPLIEERPGVGPSRLSPTKRVTYQARDGLSIPAYLTLPRGRDPKQLPLIALVHGGPHARDWIHWDPEVQLFASRGYAVLQMNFRGSSGLGTKFLEAGYREWGQKIQDDITDGVKWAISEGIADPDRVGIYGTSFGGYSALAGAVKTPDLYRAAAGYAPVTDIELTLSEESWYGARDELTETFVGGERGDKERLRASSPLRHAERVQIPILLGHGTDDPTVHVRQSQRMAKALRDAGKDVSYLEFPDEIHGFVLESNRIRWYEALIAFFEKNLAPREAAITAAK